MLLHEGGRTMQIPRRLRKTDDVYRTVPLHDIPWITDNPPEVLVRLVKSGIIQPCRCIELGCGIGNHALFLCHLCTLGEGVKDRTGLWKKIQIDDRSVM